MSTSAVTPRKAPASIYACVSHHSVTRTVVRVDDLEVFDGGHGHAAVEVEHKRLRLCIAHHTASHHSTVQDTPSFHSGALLMSSTMFTIWRALWRPSSVSESCPHLFSNVSGHHQIALLWARMPMAAGARPCQAAEPSSCADPRSQGG